MKGKMLTNKKIYGIIINAPKIGAAQTAIKVGCSIKTVYNINHIAKKMGYAIIRPRKMSLQEKVNKALKALNLI